MNEYIPKNYTGIIEWENGDKYWYKEGFCHREDGPAIVGISGFKAWWINGKKHRIDGPAIKYMAGNEYWYVDGDIYFISSLNWFIEQSVFLGKEKGKYDLYWLRFLTEDGIKEFPIIPGMNLDKVEGYKQWTMILSETE